jgi:hypothetical protein
VIRRTVTAGLFLSVLGLAGGQPSPAAIWSETLDASAHAAYVTNPQFVPGSKLDDESGVLAVDGNTTVQAERSELTVTPRFTLTRYHRERDLDINAGAVDLSYLRKLERGQWTLSGQALTDSTVTSELGLTGLTNVNRRHDAGTVSTVYRYSSSERLSWQLQGAWQVTRYSDAGSSGLTEFRYGSVQLGPTWSFSEHLLGSILVGADRTSPQGGQTQNDYPVSLVLKRTVSERYAWRASIGATRVEAGRGSAGTSSLYELGASRQGERLHWDVSVRRSVAPVGFGELTRQDQAMLGLTAVTSERSSVSLAVSALRSRPLTYLNFLVYSGASWEQANAEWQYRLSTKWSLSAAYTYARARNGDLQPWARGNQARLGIVWNSGRL